MSAGPPRADSVGQRLRQDANVPLPEAGVRLLLHPGHYWQGDQRPAPLQPGCGHQHAPVRRDHLHECVATRRDTAAVMSPRRRAEAASTARAWAASSTALTSPERRDSTRSRTAPSSPEVMATAASRVTRTRSDSRAHRPGSPREEPVLSVTLGQQPVPDPADGLDQRAVGRRAELAPQVTDVTSTMLGPPS